MPDQNQPINPTPSFPDIPDIPAAPAADTAPQVPTPQPKKNKGRILATILGIFLLVGAVGAGVILVGQRQLFQQKAGDEVCVAVSRCTDEHMCPNPCYDVVNLGACTPPQEGYVMCDCVRNDTSCNNPTSTPSNCLPNESTCSEGSQCCTLICVSNKCRSATSCDKTCSPDHLEEPGYCGGTNNEYWCNHIIGDPLQYNGGNSCPAPYNHMVTLDECNYCSDTTGQHPCDAGVRCSLAPDPRCTGGTPTPPPGATPTPTPTATPTLPPGCPTAPQCTGVKAYDTGWNLLTSAQLSALTAGDKVRFAASCTPVTDADKAEFTINTVETEVTTQKPGTGEYYYEYTIPSGVTSFTVSAKLHSISLGIWF